MICDLSDRQINLFILTGWLYYSLSHQVHPLFLNRIAFKLQLLKSDSVRMKQHYLNCPFVFVNLIYGAIQQMRNIMHNTVGEGRLDIISMKNLLENLGGMQTFLKSECWKKFILTNFHLLMISVEVFLNSSKIESEKINLYKIFLFSVYILLHFIYFHIILLTLFLFPFSCFVCLFVCFM